MAAGIRLLELTRNMHRLFEKQQAAEKRRLLDFVVSNSVWREGKIFPVWRQPFDMIALANNRHRWKPLASRPKAA
jgi:site-specific DNA recombinase